MCGLILMVCVMVTNTCTRGLCVAKSYTCVVYVSEESVMCLVNNNQLGTVYFLCKSMNY